MSVWFLVPLIKITQLALRIADCDLSSLLSVGPGYLRSSFSSEGFTATSKKAMEGCKLRQTHMEPRGALRVTEGQVCSVPPLCYLPSDH